MTRLLASYLLLALLLAVTSAFAPLTTTTPITTALYFFGGLKDAFKNDDALGKAKDPGLSNGPKFNEQVTVNGKDVPGAVAGQKLTAVANKVRVKIPVNCQQGDCGTWYVCFCDIKLVMLRKQHDRCRFSISRLASLSPRALSITIQHGPSQWSQSQGVSNTLAIGESYHSNFIRIS